MPTDSNQVVAPTPEFRRAAWARLQAALDPLGVPRPLRGVDAPQVPARPFVPAFIR